MNKSEIVSELFSMRDNAYALGQIKTIPSVPAGRFIGVRTPELRALAKRLRDDPETDEFLSDMPHQYFEEDQLHAFIISLEADFDKCVNEVEAFLPFIDNWATCDQLLPKVFKKHPDRLLPYIRIWIESNKTYTIRFSIGLLMRHFLDSGFKLEYPDMVAAVRSYEYYVRMMIAWYFATALSMQNEAVLPYLENKRLDSWTHNKTIQKCIESFRITDAQKSYLRTLKIK